MTLDEIIKALKTTAATAGYNAKLPGLGITEAVGTPYNPLNTPYNQYNRTAGLTQPTPSTSVETNPIGFTPQAAYGGDRRILGAATYEPLADTNTKTGGGDGGGGPAPVPDTGRGINLNGEREAQINLARSAFETLMRSVSDNFNRARGIYDEGTQMLSKKRDTFKTQFGEGQDKILDRYETERGNLQAGAQGAQTRSLNALRALGLGGSAILRSGGRQTQENAKAFGGLQTQRNENDNANTSLYNDRLTWADSQDSALRRSLEDAQSARNAAEAQGGLVLQGDVNGINSNFSRILSSIQQNADAINAAKNGVAGYTANPYSVNIPDLTAAISADLPAIGTTTTGGENQGVNVNGFTDILSMLDPRKRAGVSGAGLYGGAYNA